MSWPPGGSSDSRSNGSQIMPNCSPTTTDKRWSSASRGPREPRRARGRDASGADAGRRACDGVSTSREPRNASTGSSRSSHRITPTAPELCSTRRRLPRTPAGTKRPKACTGRDQGVPRRRRPHGRGQEPHQLWNVLWERGAHAESRERASRSPSGSWRRSLPARSSPTCYASSAAARIVAVRSRRRSSWATFPRAGDEARCGCRVSRALSYRGVARCFSGDRGTR